MRYFFTIKDRYTDQYETKEFGSLQEAEKHYEKVAERPQLRYRSFQVWTLDENGNKKQIKITKI